MSFPRWVPSEVVNMAVSLWRLHEEGGPHDWKTEGQEMILRLARDPRMENVWDELRKKHVRVNPPYVWSLYLKIFGEMPNPNDDPRDIAPALLFYQVNPISLPFVPDIFTNPDFPILRSRAIFFEPAPVRFWYANCGS
jgi:hypothetical protein